MSHIPPPPPPPPSALPLPSLLPLLPPSRNPSPSPEKKGGGILNFLSEAKSKIVRVLTTPPANFLHSPANAIRASDGRRSSSVHSLNFVPFQSRLLSSSHSGKGENVYNSNDLTDMSSLGDLETLENQVIHLEKSVHDILTEGEGNTKPNPPDTTSIKISPHADPVNLESLEGIFGPSPNDILNSKLPISVYAELIAMYDHDLNGMGRGLCGSGICCSDEPRNEDDLNAVEGDRLRSRDKERNIRKEVMKYNKD